MESMPLPLLPLLPLPLLPLLPLPPLPPPPPPPPPPLSTSFASASMGTPFSPAPLLNAAMSARRWRCDAGATRDIRHSPQRMAAREWNGRLVVYCRSELLVSR